MRNEVKASITIGIVGMIVLGVIIVWGYGSIQDGKRQIAEMEQRQLEIAASEKWEAERPQREAASRRKKMQIEEQKRKEMEAKRIREREIARRQRETIVVERKKTRREIVESQFSVWDGSHRNFTKIIKSLMNDPSSYKHVSTRYIDKGDKILVITNFRGSNAFGGIVTNTMSAFFDVNGNLIEILQ